MRISFIGVGNMSGAIIKSIIGSKRVSPSDMYLYDKFDNKCDDFAAIGCNKCRDLSEVCIGSNIIVLAVKPQDYENLLVDIKNAVENPESKTFVSIAAGISTSYICDVLGANCPVVRVMPNTPLLLGVGATAISRNKYVTDKDYTKICTLFAASGTVTALDESLMNNVISVNSSSPVYLYILAQAMIDGATEQGIDEKMATELVFQTLKGSVEMLSKSGYSPSELIKMVASPNGTTEAAIKSLRNDNFNEILQRAMRECTRRANEISK